MNKKQLILLCMLAAGGSIQAQQWPDAPAEARPGTRWWWLGSAVDEKNLTYNLEEYACRHGRRRNHSHLWCTGQ